MSGASRGSPAAFVGRVHPPGANASCLSSLPPFGSISGTTVALPIDASRTSRDAASRFSSRDTMSAARKRLEALLSFSPSHRAHGSLAMYILSTYEATA